MIYIYIYLTLLLLYFVKRNSKVLLFLVLLFFSFLVGYRGYDVGTDTHRYLDIYNSIGGFGYRLYPEPLYGYFCFFSNRLGFSFQLFQTISTLFSLLFVGWVIMKKSPFYNMSLFYLFCFYYIFYAMNIHREIMACFIMIMAYQFLLGKKYYDKVIYVFFCVLASGFHYSALILVILIFIKLLRRFVSSWMAIVFCLLLSFSVGFIAPSNWYEGFAGKYEKLISGDANNQTDLKAIQSVFLSIYWIIEFLFISRFGGIKIMKTDYYYILLCGVIINNLLMKSALGLRVFLYFNILQIIIIPIIIASSKNKFGVSLLFIVYISIFFFVFLYINSARVVPYVLNI